MTEGFNWRDVVQSDVESMPVRRERVPSGKVTLSIPMQAGLAERIEDAAAERGITRASYVKRAVMAMLAHDLGVPLGAIALVDPQIVRDTGFAITDDLGTAFGPWEIAALVGDEGGDVDG